MIDPSLSVPEPGPEPEPAPAGTAPPYEAAAPQPAASDEVDFDAIAADRFAAAYRPSWEPPAPVGASSPAPKPISSRPVVVAASIAPAAIGVDEPIAPLRTKEARQRALLGIGAAVLGFLALAYFTVSGSSKVPERQVASRSPEAAPTPSGPAAAVEPQEQAPAAPSAAAGPTPTTLEAPTPEPATTAAPAALAAAPSVPTVVTHRVSVSTKPRDAQLFLDELAVSNPFEAQLPLGADHELRALADGYETATQRVHVAGDTRISLVLTQKPAAAVPKPAAAVQPPKPRASNVSTRRKAQATATSKPTAKPASKPKAKASKGAGFVADSPY